MLDQIKLNPVLKCNADDNIINVAKQLKQSIQRYIYVVDEKDYPIGIISTTDMNNKVIAEARDPNQLKAKDIMTKNIEIYDINEDAIKVYKEMRQNRRMAVAVVKNKKFEGVLSFNMLLNHITGGVRR